MGRKRSIPRSIGAVLMSIGMLAAGVVSPTLADEGDTGAGSGELRLPNPEFTGKITELTDYDSLEKAGYTYTNTNQLFVCQNRTFDSKNDTWAGLGAQRDPATSALTDMTYHQDGVSGDKREGFYGTIHNRLWFAETSTGGSGYLFEPFFQDLYVQIKTTGEKDLEFLDGTTPVNEHALVAKIMEDPTKYIRLQSAELLSSSGSGEQLHWSDIAVPEAIRRIIMDKAIAQGVPREYFMQEYGSSDQFSAEQIAQYDEIIGTLVSGSGVETAFSEWLKTHLSVEKVSAGEIVLKLADFGEDMGKQMAITQGREWTEEEKEQYGVDFPYGAAITGSLSYTDPETGETINSGGYDVHADSMPVWNGYSRFDFGATPSRNKKSILIYEDMIRDESKGEPVGPVVALDTYVSAFAPNESGSYEARVNYYTDRADLESGKTAEGETVGNYGASCGGVVELSASAKPAVKVVKKINGEDANELPGVKVAPGQDMNITFEVSNTGETPLKDVTVSDDKIKNASDIKCENKPETLEPGKSFTCSATLKAPESGTHTDTATVTGTPVDEEGNPVGDTPVTHEDPANATVEKPLVPAVKVVKKINGEDANSEPGVVVAPGQDMNITFEVSNTGETPLKDVTVSDDKIKNASDIKCENKPEVLAPGESFTCSATLKAPATAGEKHKDIATVSATPVDKDGNPVGDTPVTHEDPANATVVEPAKVVKHPSVRVVKKINGEDANVKPGVKVQPGSDMNITFEVTNDGDVAVGSVSVSDNKIPADQITCDDKPETLNPGESFTCQASLKAPASGEHTNIASVEATPIYGEGETGSDSPVKDSDPAHASVDEPTKVVKHPSVSVVKKINGEDANVKPGVLVQPGADMNITFEVTNDGTATLENVEVTDNVIPADKITCANKPDTLAPGESFTCQATVKAPVSGKHVNIASVQATPVYGEGETGSDEPARDSDPAHASVDEPTKVVKVPSVRVVKKINGEDANANPGVKVQPGEDMKVTFEVTNDGDVALAGAVVSDNVIPADQITCDDKPETLAPGKSFTCSASLKAPEFGKHTNIATVEATPVYADGESGPEGPVTDVDSAKAWVDEPQNTQRVPSVRVVKKINGQDANVAPGVKVAPGSDMNITFEVTNDGTATLGDVTVTDNVIPADQITCDDKPDTLAPGQSFTCEATVQAPASGDHVNIATVEATPVYADGESGSDTPVKDTDAARAWVDEPVKEVKKPSIKVVKKINGEDANVKPGAEVAPGSDMNITFEVSNTGTATLEKVEVTDNVIPADQITCENKPETLAPGESFTCEATVKAPAAGKHVNVASVEATPVYADGETGSDSPVKDSDEANAWVKEPQKDVKHPSVSVVKKINGQDAGDGLGVELAPGSDMDITFEVTNTGTATLDNVTLTDNVIPADQITCDDKPEALAPGESFTCSATLPAPAAGKHVNIATVEATPVYAEGESGPTDPVGDSDTAKAWVKPKSVREVFPAVEVVKKINGQEASADPGVKVAPGSQMDITFEVSNIGTATLENITVSDNVIPADQITCDDKPEALAPGESFTCSATLPAPVSGKHVNVATVEATPVYGDGESGSDGPVGDSDVAKASVDPKPQGREVFPSVKVAKKINGQDADTKPGVKVQPGEDMDITFEVTNDGTATLGDIALSDNVIPADQITCDDKPNTLKPGESFICHATLKAPMSGGHVNVATVEATPVYGDGEFGSDGPVGDSDVAKASVDDPASDKPGEDTPGEDVKPDKPGKPHDPASDDSGKPGDSDSGKPGEPGSDAAKPGDVIAGEVTKHCDGQGGQDDSAAKGAQPADSGVNGQGTGAAKGAADAKGAKPGDSAKATTAKTAKTDKAGAKTNTGGKTQKSGARVTTGGHLRAA
ncbi:hypothetical protein [Corynebacterium sp. sy039]|uniref:DUF7507 domain-containing protein n=1 Tax=Corynebacterium sp. sy039 TaxID=2599641 RepID=UPI0011B5C303|nr:hypothetical protein [Corynebacterium sp. sy039]QDZ41775.1 hypothetical protein FQV43_00280 [Corynebacterium sp. sy039]